MATATEEMQVDGDNLNPATPVEEENEEVEADNDSNVNNNSTNNNSEADEEDQEDSGDDEKGEESVELGGTASTRCFGLLDGMFEDPETGARSRVTIPITRLPATFGRSHDTEDPHFFGLGKKKALSRKQCRISYRDAEGGKVEWDKAANELVYKNPGDNDGDDHDNLKDEEDLPSKGFFVVECLGKNRILVNHNRVDQGNAAVIHSGSPIRISSYMLYFLLPTDASPKEHVVAAQPLESTVSSQKKRKTPDAAPSSSPVSKKPKPAGTNYQNELDSLSVETLLERMTAAIEKNEWERRHQLIGATIALHAVRDAARDAGIQAIANKGGVSRSEIMMWIEESTKYSEWVRQMLTKMEPRSYQAAVTKCLLKAGFTRTGSSGRYIKWYLPKDIPLINPNEWVETEKPDTHEDSEPKQPENSQIEEKEDEAEDEEPKQQENSQTEEKEDEAEDEEEGEGKAEHGDKGEEGGKSPEDNEEGDSGSVDKNEEHKTSTNAPSTEDGTIDEQMDDDEDNMEGGDNDEGASPRSSDGEKPNDEEEDAGEEDDSGSELERTGGTTKAARLSDTKES